MEEKYDPNYSPGDELMPGANSGTDSVDPKTGLLGFLTQLLGGLFHGNTSSFGNFVNEVMGINSQRREFAQQEYLQDKQNDYDSFGSQFDRMISEGVNPNLAAKSLLGGAGTTSNAAPSVPSSNGSAAAGLSSLLNMLNPALQVSEMQKNRADAENTETQTEGMRIDNFFKPLEKRQGLALLRAETNAAIKKGNLDEKSAQLMQWQYDFNVKVEPWMVQKLQGEALLISQQIETEIRRTRLTGAQADVAENEINVQNSVINLNNANAGLARANTSLVGEQARLTKFQAQRELINLAYEQFVRAGIPMSVQETEYIVALHRKGMHKEAERYVDEKVSIAGKVREKEIEGQYSGKNFLNQVLLSGAPVLFSHLTPDLNRSGGLYDSISGNRGGSSDKPLGWPSLSKFDKLVLLRALKYLK